MLFYSPAKLNLFFRILRKRSDGYHEIASLLQTIDLYDTLSFTQSDSDRLTCSNAKLPCDETNLVVKALRLFRSRFSLPYGVDIHLEKRIPMQAGFGGGSSNAATTLWALNELAERPAPLYVLMEMGAMLGSDVPFFFSSGTAYCTGRGEILESFTLPDPLTGWFAKPPFGLSTPLVYKETRVEELPEVEPRLGLTKYPLFYNDLEPAALRLEPRLQVFRIALERMFDSVTMTGSGTAFFCERPKRTVERNGYCTWPDGRSISSFHSIQRQQGGWYGRYAKTTLHHSDRRSGDDRIGSCSLLERPSPL